MTRRLAHPILLALVTLSLLLVAPPPAPAARGDVFYAEDFSSVQTGYLPRDWAGGQNLMVQEVRGRKFVGFFQDYRDSIAVNGVPFSRDYQLDFVVNQCENGYFQCVVGGARVKVYNDGDCSLNDSRDHAKVSGSVMKFSLRKEGPLQKLLVNDQVVLMGRYPETSAPSSFSLEIRGSDAKIFQIVGREL